MKCLNNVFVQRANILEVLTLPSATHINCTNYGFDPSTTLHLLHVILMTGLSSSRLCWVGLVRSKCDIVQELLGHVPEDATVHEVRTKAGGNTTMVSIVFSGRSEVNHLLAAIDAYLAVCGSDNPAKLIGHGDSGMLRYKVSSAHGIEAAVPLADRFREREPPEAESDGDGRPEKKFKGVQKNMSKKKRSREQQPAEKTANGKDQDNEKEMNPKKREGTANHGWTSFRQFISYVVQVAAALDRGTLSYRGAVYTFLVVWFCHWAHISEVSVPGGRFLAAIVAAAPPYCQCDTMLHISEPL